MSSDPRPTIRPFQLFLRSVSRLLQQAAPIVGIALVVYLPTAVLASLDRPGLVSLLATVLRYVSLFVLAGLVAGTMIRGQGASRVVDLLGVGLRGLGSVVVLSIVPILAFLLVARLLNQGAFDVNALPLWFRVFAILVSLVIAPIFARVGLSGPLLVVENLSPARAHQRAIELSQGARFRLGLAILPCWMFDWLLEGLGGKLGLPLAASALVILVASALSASLLAVILTLAYEDLRGAPPEELAGVFA